MRPESVRINVTLCGAAAPVAVRAFGLLNPITWQAVFFEDVTAGVAPSTPLLDAGVVLHARGLPAGDGQDRGLGSSTITLRPCRWSQLSEDFFTNSVVDAGPAGHELRIEADWAGPRRELVASMTAPWSDDRLRAVRAGALPVAGLFDERQRRFLERCAPGRVNLSAVTPLAVVRATRWPPVGVEAGGVHLSVRGERWQADGVDLLELSVVSSVEGAEKDQAALAGLVADRALVADPDPAAGDPGIGGESLTRRLLPQLVRTGAAN